MTFYIKPPSGLTLLENLESYTLTRMRFLLSVDECESRKSGSEQQGSIVSLNADSQGTSNPQRGSPEGDDSQASGLKISERQGSLQCFQALLREEEYVAYSDCLIEGSRKDRISHFTLRLACSMDQDLQHFFMTAEKKLFHFRFCSMNAEELAAFLRSTQKFLSKLLRRSNKVISEGKFSFLLKNLHDILLKIYNVGQSWEDVAQKYVEGSAEEAVEVPFQCALDLIAERKVELNAGMASIPISKLDTIMSGLFEKVLWHGMMDSQRALDMVLDDERMEDLFDKVCGMFSTVKLNMSYIYSKKGNNLRMTLRDVDKNVDGFPLCMSHLHQTLRWKHRLRHFSRIQYTLFLKDAGLSVNDAINFWKMEYSRPQKSKIDAHHACSHSWSKDAKRYTYSIRHLYGLEGSHINYRSHSCTSIQNTCLGHGEEGGCPYKHFDEHSLMKALAFDRLHPKVVTEILLSARNHCYADACLKHRKAKFEEFLTDECVPCNTLESKFLPKFEKHSLPRFDNSIKVKQKVPMFSTKVQRLVETLQVKSETSDEELPLLSMETDDKKLPLWPIEPKGKQGEESNYACCENEPFVPSNEQFMCNPEISEFEDKMKNVFLQFHKPISRPIDYFISFQNLLDGLKNLESENMDKIVDTE
ncbi:DNA primase large subunit-like isoform X1 [Anneissia japonica]|uniref:DNA primase large subunit-like isoform X1 n=1 Tax=Anneissia japonica TaxID=1529436 RepID=UPI0014255C29|nr:DNA primase large subunit-like isoform X1 [Anneissia japonica]